jgi:glycosyltransferase involved in cell wall biosynthesis
VSKTGTILDFQSGGLFGNVDDPPFKEGRPADHKHGVMYKAPWEHEGDGFSEHSRRSAVALADTGCPVHLRGFASYKYNRHITEEIRPLLTTSIARYSVEIFQVIVQGSMIHNIIQNQSFLSEEERMRINAFRVLYSVWERDRISPDLVRSIRCFGQVWTACEENAEMLIRCGIDPLKVRVVPVPYFENDPLLKVADYKKRNVRKLGPPRFYHIGKWEPRKAQDRIIHCFMKAFRPGEAHLFIRASRLRDPHPDYPGWATDALVKSLCDDDVKINGWNESNWKISIQFVDKFLTSEQIVTLHKYADVYVTLSHGEGFDMPAYDAKLAGNSMIYTPSGGPQDFAHKSDFLVPRTKMVPVSSFYEWENDATYIDYSDKDAVSAFRRSAAAVRLGVNGQSDLGQFAAKEVGSRMFQNLQDLVEQYGGRVY